MSLSTISKAGKASVVSKLEKKWERDTADEAAREFRYVVTDMICRAGSGHLGGALSLVEVIITLYYRILRVRPGEPRWPDRDRLILSKGHAGPILYAALAYKGYFPFQWLATMNQDGTKLPSHVDQLRTPGIDMTAGSLGQGLSCACGVRGWQDGRQAVSHVLHHWRRRERRRADLGGRHVGRALQARQPRSHHHSELMLCGDESRPHPSEA